MKTTHKLLLSGETVRRMREEMGLTAKELGQKLGYPRAYHTIHEIELGKYRMGEPAAKYFDCLYQQFIKKKGK